MVEPWRAARSLNLRHLTRTSISAELARPHPAWPNCLVSMMCRSMVRGFAAKWIQLN